jgi:hypothetical protein
MSQLGPVLPKWASSGAGHDAGFLEFNGAQREAIVRFQINVYNFASSPLTFKSLGDRLMSVGRMASMGILGIGARSVWLI